MVAASQYLDNAGVIVERRPVVANRTLNAVSILVPLIGTLAVFYDWSLLAPTVATLATFLLFFVLQVVGIGVGLHRYFTHRAFKAGRAVRAVLAVLGSSAFQGPIDRWVADHRRHHRYTDQPLDPHSPYWINGRPAPARWRGLLHAHVGWMLTCPVSDPERYARDIRRDPISGWCSRHYWWLCAASLLAPTLVGLAVGGAPEAVRGLFWGGCLRVAVLHHLTWSINSVGHAFGRRASGSRDQSRDITVFSLLLFGEGFHSYHHSHPSAAVNEPSHLDFGGLLVRALARAGLVWDVKRA